MGHKRRLKYSFNNNHKMSLFKIIIELLQLDNYIKGSEHIQIAKGINSLPKGPREIMIQVRREIHIRNKK
jgi:hypothetical protein